MEKPSRLGPAALLLLLLAVALPLGGQAEEGYTFTTLVGRNNIGAVDGVGAQARFHEAAGIASDSDGNLYVIDAKTHVVRKITPGASVSTIAGLAANFGTADGASGSARFSFAYGIAVSEDGTIYVADTGNNSIRKITADGFVQTVAGGRSGSQDGLGNGAAFKLPESLAVDTAGVIYVADTGNHTIRIVDKNGEVTTLAGEPGSAGTADGTGSGARFNSPGGIAVDAEGNLYVADTQNHAIRKVTTAGVVTTFAGLPGVIGSNDGTGNAARFSQPRGVATDNAGNVYVNDSQGGLLRKITPQGNVTTLASGLAYGRGVTVDRSSGNIFAADTGHHLIKKITPGGSVSIFAGADVTTGSQDGVGTKAQFYQPQGIVIAGTGEIFVADSNSSAIRKVDPNLFVTTWAGNFINRLYGAVDGLRTAAAFANPIGMAMDANGNIIVADWNSTIRRIDPTGYVTTIAGAHQLTGNADGPGLTARFNGPQGVAVDKNGKIYVADTGNHTIRIIDATGHVATAFGQTGTKGSADGVGNAARFSSPTGLAFDEAGMLYVADTNNYSIRKISPDGVVTTLAGNYRRSGGADGKGIEATFTAPAGVVVDGNGIVFVTDATLHTIRKIGPDGTVTTIGGLAGQPGIADGTGSAARFSRPWGITVDRWGFLYVTDANNNTVRKGVPAGSKPPVFTEQPASMTIGAGHDATFTATADALPAPMVYWMRQPAGTDGFEPLIESEQFSGVKTATLKIAAVTSQMNGDKFVCVAENGLDLSPISKSAALTVIPAPTFTSEAEATFTVGVSGTFTIAASGAKALALAPGALPSWATFDPATGVISGTPTELSGAPFSIEIQASNEALLPATQTFTLKVSPGPAITVNPADQTAHAGRTAVLFADVAGAAPITLQWTRNGVALADSQRISGATTTTLAIAEATAADAGTYALEATGGNGKVTSQPAVLTVATAPKISMQPIGQTVADGSRASFTVTATSSSPVSFQWLFNGQPINGATASIYTIPAVTSSWVGQYSVKVSDAVTSVVSEPAILNVLTEAKLSGSGDEVGPDITHPNGNVYDQVLLTGSDATVKADTSQVLRISYVDLSDDIVQVEFSGAGTLSLKLDDASGPAAPVKYNQAVKYMRGHATLTIAGADESTNVSVFTVGRITAINQALFRDDVSYDGVADIGSISITSTNGKFGGIYAGDASCFNTRGLSGIYAPGVAFVGPVVIGNISASDTAEGVFVIGSANDVRIAGGDLAQANHRPLEVAGLTTLKFTAGANSHGVAVPAKANRARLEHDGADVTAEIVANPAQ